MAKYDLERILKDAEKLEVMPFLAEVVSFVKDAAPILDKINRSVAENVAKLPGASQKLSKVTEATEVATVDIMDKLDRIFASAAKIRSAAAKISENESKQAVESAVGQIETDAGEIMNALQVQDITSQQIAAVNHVLQVVGKKLSVILQKYDVSKISEFKEEIEDSTGTQISELHRKIAFDPRAIDALTGKENRQGDVDDVFARFASGENIEIGETSEEKASQDDVDALLGSFSDREAESVDSEVSQDDIDALFGGGGEEDSEESGGDSDDEVSQDDIDKLFG